MPPQTEDTVISRLELVLPKNILYTCVSLKRGSTAEFVSDNTKKYTRSRISASKQIDESVRLTVTVSKLQRNSLQTPENTVDNETKENIQDKICDRNNRDEYLPDTSQLYKTHLAVKESQISETADTSKTVSIVNHDNTKTVNSPGAVSKYFLPEYIQGVHDEISEDQSDKKSLDTVVQRQDIQQHEIGFENRQTPSGEVNIVDTCKSLEESAFDTTNKTIEDSDVESTRKSYENSTKVSSTEDCEISQTDLATIDDVRKLVRASSASSEVISFEESELTTKTIKGEEKEALCSEKDNRKKEAVNNDKEFPDDGYQLSSDHGINIETSPLSRDNATEVEASTDKFKTHFLRNRKRNNKKQGDSSGQQTEISFDFNTPEQITNSKKKSLYLGISEHTAHMDRSHMIRPHYKREQNIQCQFCPGKLKDNQSLYDHARLRHSNSPGYSEYITGLKELIKVTCNVCKKVYSRREQLAVHMSLVHTSSNSVECPKCGVRVKSDHHLKSHMRRIHNNANSLHLCHLCPASFKVPSYLSAHLKYVHTSNPEDAFPCDECGKTYSSSKYLRNHKARVHGSKRHGCSYCGKAFNSLANMRRHVMLLHEKKGEKPFQCKTCGRRFTLKANWKDHVNTLHLNSYSLHCSVCNLGFRRKKDLQTHEANAHGIPMGSSVAGLKEIVPSTDQGPVAVIPICQPLSGVEQAQPHVGSANIQYIMATPEILKAFGIQFGGEQVLGEASSKANPKLPEESIVSTDELDSANEVQNITLAPVDQRKTPGVSVVNEQTVIIEQTCPQDNIDVGTIAESEVITSIANSATITEVTNMDAS